METNSDPMEETSKDNPPRLVKATSGLIPTTDRNNQLMHFFQLLRDTNNNNVENTRKSLVETLSKIPSDPNTFKLSPSSSLCEVNRRGGVDKGTPEETKNNNEGDDKYLNPDVVRHHLRYLQNKRRFLMYLTKKLCLIVNARPEADSAARKIDRGEDNRFLFQPIQNLLKFQRSRRTPYSAPPLGDANANVTDDVCRRFDVLSLNKEDAPVATRVLSGAKSELRGRLAKAAEEEKHGGRGGPMRRGRRSQLINVNDMVDHLGDLTL